MSEFRRDAKFQRQLWNTGIHKFRVVAKYVSYDWFINHHSMSNSLQSVSVPVKRPIYSTKCYKSIKYTTVFILFDRTGVCRLTAAVVTVMGIFVKQKIT